MSTASKYTAEQVDKMDQMLSSGTSCKDVAKLFGCSRKHVYSMTRGRAGVRRVKIANRQPMQYMKPLRPPGNIASKKTKLSCGLKYKIGLHGRLFYESKDGWLLSCKMPSDVGLSV